MFSYSFLFYPEWAGYIFLTCFSFGYSRYLYYLLFLLYALFSNYFHSLFEIIFHLFLLLLLIFTTALADGFSVELQWQQASSSLQDSSQNSGQSLCSNLDRLLSRLLQLKWYDDNYCYFTHLRLFSRQR